MGFHVEINSILRSDDPITLQKGAVVDFRKDGSRVFFDNIPIWLTRNDWTALAEIQVVSQTRDGGGVSGKFRIRHIYGEDEQGPITEMFRRMYASGGDPYIYILIAKSDYEKAKKNGTLYEDSLETQGFIHASPIDQLTRVANKYYATAVDVQVMVVEAVEVYAAIKWEPATGGLYPHIYGPLNMNAVARVVPVSKNSDGLYKITPESLK